MSSHRRIEEEDIAIIGMAARFPGASSLSEYWRNLVDGVESVRIYTEDEMLAAGVDAADLEDPNYVRAAAIVDGIDQFDAAFFDFTPREADIRDPQQRLFLEAAYDAFTHAGYDPARCDAAVGVYGGVFTNRYTWLNVRRNRQVLEAVGSLAAEIANHADYLATLVSYKLNLQGPSLTVATACSTSAVATHLACQALRAAECDMALAGGVEVELPYGHGFTWAEGGIFTKDGHCRPFDAGATGTIFGTGCGVVLMKRLPDALRDRDTVHAVIKGSAINNDGSRKVGFTAPGLEGQMKVIAEAYGVTGIDPTTISYLEAHGTGTAVGDPIEISALSNVFLRGTERRRWCGLGSVKGNIGHMGPAAGVAALIKTTLALEHRQLPPSINYDAPNPRIDFENSPFRVNTSLVDWERGDTPLRAGVSSFGIGGTNAHLILEEAPEPEPAGPSRTAQLLVVSARSEAALDASCERLARHLAEHAEQDLADVAHTLQVGRSAFRHRRALACRRHADADQLLRRARAASGTGDNRERPVAFMFPGQGTQHVGMAHDLYVAEELFRGIVDHCAQVLLPHLGLDLREVVYAAGAGSEEAVRLLTRTGITQPAVFVVEYALARQLMAWGVTPRAMIGHSIGEYVAACLAGVFSLEDALDLVAARGRLMQALPTGSMLAVPMDAAAVNAYLRDSLSLAAVNAPSMCVVSGPDTAIDQLEEELGRHGLSCPRLRTSHAFHSAMMDPILPDFAERVGRVARGTVEVPFVSNVTGTWITDEQAADPEYWSGHLRGCVRFADGLATLAANERMLLLEVGPGQTLSGLARAQLGGERIVVPTLHHPQRPEPDLPVTLQAVGALWANGAVCDWEAFNRPGPRRRVPLPTYPYERSRHWVDPDPTEARPAVRIKVPPGRKLPLEDSFFLPTWRETVPAGASGSEPVAGPWLVLCDHAGVGERVADRLRARGHDVVVAGGGDAFEPAEDGSWRFDPRRPEDYDRLLGALAERPPRAILHLLSLAPSGPDDVDPVSARSTEELGYFSLCWLAQAMAKHDAGEPRQVVVVTNGAHEVRGGDGVNPVAALVLGPCSVIPKELLDVACRTVDVELPASEAEMERLAARLTEEVERPAPELIVALRGRRRWVRDFLNPAVPQAEPDAFRARLRERGVYLVTGGLGAVALTLVEEIAGTVPGTFVLVGRRRFPEPDEWDAWLDEHGEADQTSRQIAALRRLRGLGADPVVMSADVSHWGRVQELVTEVRARFGRIDGVIHAAGLGGGGMILAKSAESHAEVLRPKVDGTLALAAAVRDDPPDFFALCSSIVGVSGDFGLVDYCAANCFMDAFANSWAGRLPGLVAIDWPAWQEIGMAVAAAGLPEAFRVLRLGGGTEPVDHPLIEARLVGSSDTITFVSTYTPATHWMLDEHRIDGSAVVPGVGYLEMALAAFGAATGETLGELRDVVFTAPLDVGERRDIRIVLEPDGERHTFAVSADAGAVWSDHATGRVGPLRDAQPEARDLEAIVSRCRAGVVRRTVEEHTGVVRVGPRWNTVDRILQGEAEELVFLAVPEEFLGDMGTSVLHPSLLDGATSFGQTLTPDGDYLPFGYGSVRVFSALPSRLVSHIRYREDRSGGEFVTCDVTLMDEAGRVLVDIEGFTLRRIDRAYVSRSIANVTEAAVKSANVGGEFSELTLGVTPAEAVDAFRRVLGHDLGPQVLVCPEHLERKLERAGLMTQKRLMEQLAGTRLAGRQSARSLDSEFVEPATDLERTLAELWSQTLGISPIGVEDEFYELGGNSLVAVQLASRVREKFKIELALPALFERPTVRGLAEIVQEALLERVRGMSEAEASALLQSLSAQP